jgi:hypothetical protein
MFVALATAALSASAVYSQTISPDIATTGLQSYVPPSFSICSKADKQDYRPNAELPFFHWLFRHCHNVSVSLSWHLPFPQTHL